MKVTGRSGATPSLGIFNLPFLLLQSLDLGLLVTKLGQIRPDSVRHVIGHQMSVVLFRDSGISVP